MNKVQVRLPVQDLFVNSAGVIHGGVISSMADVAMSNLIPATENERDSAGVTIDLNVSFFKAATGEYLIVHAKVEKQAER